jgi:urate oxidase
MATPPIGEAEKMPHLAENSYGKSQVRVVRLNRQSHQHQFEEWDVEVLLQGDFLTCFTEGDNGKILPTDTMKNTVYSLARASSAGSVEEFAKELIRYFLQRNPQVSGAETVIRQKSWQPLYIAGKPHPSTFVQSGSELQTTRVSEKRGETLRITSGLADLLIMKTAGSAFEGYLRDSLTTLPETSDRLFGTSLRAHWIYTSADLPFPTVRSSIRDSLLSTFAAHQSKSVQHTLYAMAENALAACSHISEITLNMPNKHCLLVDLTRFGQDNPNHIFVPTDEPHGSIEARVCRQG